MRPDGISIDYHCHMCNGSTTLTVSLPPQQPPIFAAPAMRCAICEKFPLLEVRGMRAQNASRIVAASAATSIPPIRQA